MIFICTQQRPLHFHNRRQEERASVESKQTIYFLDNTVLVEVNNVGFAARLSSKPINVAQFINLRCCKNKIWWTFFCREEGISGRVSMLVSVKLHSNKYFISSQNRLTARFGDYYNVQFIHTANTSELNSKTESLYLLKGRVKQTIQHVEMLRNV